MSNKYNLALVPRKKRKEIIELAQQFSPFAYQYILGEHSFPHVTLSHFKWHEEKLADLWAEVDHVWRHQELHLIFEKFSWTTSDHSVYWVALMPDKRDVLFEMHKIISDLLVIAIKDSYDPHMTLLNTQNPECKREIDNVSYSYVAMDDMFTLVLGKADESGQLTEILYINE